MGLFISNLEKSYNGIPVFRDFSVEIAEGTITCILGPSGCGKTTLLNIIGKIITPGSGHFVGFEGKQFSYIFQEPRLLPWKTVKGNIEFVQNQNMPAGERKRRVDHLIGLVELGGFADYYPAQLSGGMRQRVSIARAFASPSDIVLMDEPLKGLDIALKQNMIRWFSQIWQEDRRTVIFVTHDLDEALLLGNEIVVLSQAPVRSIAHEKVDQPAGTRSVEDAQLKKLKKALLKALGQQDQE